jgi:hypothetical protein
LYKVDRQDEKTKKNIEEKFKKYIADEDVFWLTMTLNTYNDKENFVTIEGFRSKAFGNNVALILKEDIKYKLTEEAIVISDENYKVLQIKKNLDEYLSQKKTEVITNQTVVPKTAEDKTVNPVNPVNKELKQEMPSSDTNNKKTPTAEKPNMEDGDGPNPNSTPKQ